MLNFFYDGDSGMDMDAYRILRLLVQDVEISLKSIQEKSENEIGYIVYDYSWIKNSWDHSMGEGDIPSAEEEEKWRAYDGVHAFFDSSLDQSLFNKLSKKSIEELRKGTAKLLIDFSFEGHNNISSVFVDLVIENCNKLNINPHNIVIVHGNVYKEKFDSTGPRIIQWSWFEDFGRPHQNILKWPNFKNWFTEQDMYDEDTVLASLDNKRTHKFLMFNRRPRNSRSVTLLFLLKHNFLKDGYVSFPNRHSHFGSDLKVFFRSALLEFPIGSFDKEINQIINMPPMTLDDDNFVLSNPTNKNPSYLYLDSYFSIVGESLMDKGVLFFSEKTFKAIKGYHPFILIGNPGSLEYLKSKGYETFSPFINEAYDKEENHVKRLKMILKEVEKLCSMKLEDLHKFYQKLKPRLIHNYNWYMYERPTDVPYVIKKLEWYINHE